MNAGFPSAFISYPFLAQSDSFIERLRDGPRFSGPIETLRERWDRFETCDRVVAEERLLTELNARIRGVSEGPDGALYVLTDGNAGKILKMTPTPARQFVCP